MMPSSSWNVARMDSGKGSAPTCAIWIGSGPPPISAARLRIVMRKDGVPT